jgi:hypothetical protein
MNVFIDAYAECAARLEGHLYGQTLGDQTQKPRFSPLGDKQIARLIFQKFIQITPRVKKVAVQQKNQTFSNLDLVDNVLYVADRAAGCFYVGQNVIRYNPDILYSRLTTCNGELAIIDMLSRMVDLKGRVLVDMGARQPDELRPAYDRVKVGRGYFRLRYPCQHYDDVQVESGYFVTIIVRDRLIQYEIYDPKKFRWGRANEPIMELSMVSTVFGITEYPRVRTIGNLMYVVGRDTFLIDMKKSRVLQHFGPLPSAYPWQKNAWEYVQHSCVRPNGNLLLMSGETIYEIEL